MISLLDGVREEIQKENENFREKYPYAGWEKESELIKKRPKKLSEYIEKAASIIRVQN